MNDGVDAQVAESEITSNVSRTATVLGTGITTTAKSTADSFNRMVEQQTRGVYTNPNQAPERQDFWYSFGVDDWDEKSSTGAGASSNKPSAIGTSGITKTGGSSVGIGSGSSCGRKAEDDDW